MLFNEMISNMFKTKKEYWLVTKYKNKEIKFDRKYDIDKFKKIYDLKNTDLPNALQSGNEIYISGEYYSVNYKYYAELFKYYWNID